MCAHAQGVCLREKESVYACVCVRKTDRQTENESSEKANFLIKINQFIATTKIAL